MYTMHLTVSPIMDLLHIEASVLARTETGEWEKIASTSCDICLSDAWLAEDPATTMLAAVRQWADMTIRA